LNPKLDGITDAKLKEKAAEQIASVKGVFTPENLLAGARLLKMMGELDPFGQADIYFARDATYSTRPGSGVTPTPRTLARA
jgi:hypothetical protein